MKNIFIIAFVFVLSAGGMCAQTPVIQQFRQIVAARDTQFKSLQNALVQDNAEAGVQLYTSTIADLPISRSVIVHTKAEGSTYMINYDVTKMDELMITMFMKIVEQYMGEINAMVKSGSYSGREFVDEGSNVTELSDAAGNVVAQYISNNENHLIMVFGK